MGNTNAVSALKLKKKTELKEGLPYNITKFEYEWNIKNFKDLNHNTGEYTSSPTLKDDWQMVLYPGGLNERTADYVSIWLKKITEKETLVEFTCEIKQNSPKNKSFIKKTIKKKLSLESCLGWSAFCKRSHIFENNVLKNGELKMKCTLQIYDDKYMDNPAIEDDDATLLELSNNMKSLLQMNYNYDVTFEINGESIFAHKAILSARSHVFCTMFNPNWKEKTHKICVTDIDREIFMILLMFLYTGECTNLNFDTAFELYYAADKYELLNLKRKCSKVMAHNLDIENAVKAISLADKHSDMVLQDFGVQFIATNATEMQNRNDWMDLIKSSPHLVNAVFECLAKQKSSTTK